MGVRICPKCEINFIKDEEKYCSICMRELKREQGVMDAQEMCSSCGEHPCELGEDLCIFCLNERKLQDAEDTANIEPLVVSAEVEIGMDEIDVPVSQDIPDTELRVIHEELGLDEEDDADSGLDETINEDDDLEEDDLDEENLMAHGLHVEHADSHESDY